MSLIEVTVSASCTVLHVQLFAMGVSRSAVLLAHASFNLLRCPRL